MSWLPGHAHDPAEMVLGLRPAAAERARELEAALYVEDRIDPIIVQLVHDRVNNLLGIEGIEFAPRTELSTREPSRSRVRGAVRHGSERGHR